MEGNFVADVRLEDSDEVLQLPIVKNKLKKMLHSAVKKIAILGAPVIPSSEDTLEEFLQAAGKFFGKDAARWDQMGDPKVEVTEDGGKRYIKSTGIFSGTELHLFVEEPYFDERLPRREDKPELTFNEKKRAIYDDEEWQEVIGDQPWTASKRRQMLTSYLQAKLEADDGELAAEGCHGFWELSISKENHTDIRMDRLAALLIKLNSNNMSVATTAAAAVWGLATTAPSRRNLSDLDVIPLLLTNLKKTLRLQTYPDGDDMPDGMVSESQRARLQRHQLGALAVVLVDRCCRRPYLQLEPDFNTLFALCQDLPGYQPRDAQMRRETAAKVLTSLVQRDGEARKSLVSSGSLRSVLGLLNPTGPGDGMIQFCMASLLATMVLDDDAMELIRHRGEAPILFESCIVLLTSTLDKLHDELDRRNNGFYEEGATALYDLYLGVRLAEACSQAMWGSAHYCVQMQPVQVKMAHVVELGKMGRDCVATDQLPLSRVCHCVTATMATLASHPDTADLIMTCPEDLALTTLLMLAEVIETENFERAGHVKASACAGVAFLACHPIGATGDECMHGPYRTKLLEMGAFGTLLKAALTSVMDPECDMIVQQAAALGVMFLSTMAGAVDGAELAMYAALLMDSDNSEMIEFLMAGMWILLRNPENRKVLGSSFNPNPASHIAKGMMNKLNDAITLHEVHDQAHEKAALVREQIEKQKEREAQRKRASADGGDGGEAPEGAASGENTHRSNQGEEEQQQQQTGEDGGAAEEGERQASGSGEQQSQQPSRSSSMKEQVGEGSSAQGEGAAADQLEDPEGDAADAGAAAPAGSAAGAPGSRGEMGSAMSTDGQGEPDADIARRSSGLGASTSQKSRQHDPMHVDGHGHGQQSGPASNAALKEQASALQGKYKNIEKRFDKQLKDNWGLETLVSVGESWLPAMLEQDEMGEATDIPVLKLFEFLVASICLFMIEDDVGPEQRELDMFRLTGPAGVPPSKRTWWTVNACAPEPESILDAQMERALSILTQIVGMRLLAAWKSVQLGVLTMWNACARNPHMERHVVERGVATKLLNIVNSTAWPPSLRDIAGGCLEFFNERFSNLGFLPPTPLPEGCPWPKPTPPANGLVPTLLGYINLINSKIPLLEYRGSHGIARLCYAAPYGSGVEGGKEYLKEAKAAAAVLGTIDAIVALMKRVNRRYQDLISGKVGSLKRAESPAHKERPPKPKGPAVLTAAAHDEEDSALYERDMCTIEAMQDIYFVMFAALLNVSVLKSTQPLVARKGLQVLLGTSTLLYSRVANARRVGANAEVEEKLLHVVSAIIQNISLHPSNRTRLYKAELKGSVALDKLIEQAVDQDEDLKQTASMLPPLVPSPKTAQHSPRSPPSPTKTSSGGANARKTAANRTQRMSPNGAVLNASVDTALASTIRPKVVFPPIVESKEDVWKGQNEALTGARNRPNGSGSHNRSRQPAQLGSTGQSVASLPPATLPPPGSAQPAQQDSGYDMMDPGSFNDSRNRFLNWLDNTFQGEGGDGTNANGQPFSGGKDDSGKKTHRKQLWDENGDWLEAEPENSKALNKLLCRPLHHLWNDSPEARGRHGQKRWEPSVSEYREVDTDTRLTRSAARLLSTQPPKDEEVLMTAATQMLTAGKYDLVSTGSQNIEYSTQRPPTAGRSNGQMALTVLQPHPEVVLAAQEQAAAVAAAQQAADATGAALDVDELRRTLKSQAGSGSGARQAVPLKVCLAPQRPRQVISFADRILVNDDPSRPMLTMFEHVDGARVCQGMFPSYQLPNGRKAFMYYTGGSLLDEVHVEAVSPPPRPSTVPQALQQTMPLADVLNLIAKPPGSAPPFIPYKPVPYLVPLPPKHTLMVKRPDLLLAEAFGDLREDNLQLIIQAKKIIKTQTTTRVENIEVKPKEEREPWTLPMSIFKPRVKESDAHGFFDTQQSLEKMFERDWQRACAKEKFTSMLARENKGNKEGKDDKAMMQELHDTLLELYQVWYSAFVYYTAGGSSDPYHMSLNAYTSFLDECQVSDPESQFIKRSDCDTIFIVCNFQPDKKSAEAQVNIENAMMRYEFLECIVRAALAKYGKGIATDDVGVAVRMLLENNIGAHLSPGARIVSNEFRTDRLYVEEVDLLLKRHQVMLKAIYSRYRLKPPGGGLRTKVVKLEGWLQFMNDAHLIDGQFTIQDAQLAFLWSRMYVIDEIKDYQRYTSLTFIDFLEAVGRVADMKSLPADSDLDTAGYTNILEWALDKERAEGTDQQGGGEGQSDIFKPRESAGYDAPKNRPLYVKLELLLDLIFRRLYWDPSNTELPFNYDGLLKLIKKIDKDMGP